jgi:hypothetical protein
VILYHRWQQVDQAMARAGRASVCTLQSCVRARPQRSTLFRCHIPLASLLPREEICRQTLDQQLSSQCPSLACIGKTPCPRRILVSSKSHRRIIIARSVNQRLWHVNEVAEHNSQCHFKTPLFVSASCPYRTRHHTTALNHHLHHVRRR